MRKPLELFQAAAKKNKIVMSEQEHKEENVKEYK